MRVKDGKQHPFVGAAKKGLHAFGNTQGENFRSGLQDG